MFGGCLFVCFSEGLTDVCAMTSEVMEEKPEGLSSRRRDTEREITHGSVSVLLRWFGEEWVRNHH